MSRDRTHFPKARPCVVCAKRPMSGVLLCGPCGVSYDNARARDGTVWAAIAWAATRARGYKGQRAATPGKEG